MANRVEAFAPFHRWDRDFHVAWLCLYWLGVIFGFYPADSGSPERR